MTTMICEMESRNEVTGPKLNFKILLDLSYFEVNELNGTIFIL